MVIGMGLAVIVWAPLCVVRTLAGREPLVFEGESITPEKQVLLTWIAILVVSVMWFHVDIQT